MLRIKNDSARKDCFRRGKVGFRLPIVFESFVVCKFFRNVEDAKVDK